MNGISVLTEGARGCGYRKQGGLYLVADAPNAPCGRMPVPLRRCPTCDTGFKPARGWTWADGPTLLRMQPCRSEWECGACPLGDPALAAAKTAGKRWGLIWVGEAFYKTAGAFMDEARTLGISRRIAALPHGFDPADPPVVLLAHRLVIREACPDQPKSYEAESEVQLTLARAEHDGCGCKKCKGEGWWMTPGIFTAFRPRVQYVCHTAIGPDCAQEVLDQPAKLEALVKRGIEPVIIRTPEQADTYEAAQQARITGATQRDLDSAASEELEAAGAVLDRANESREG